MTAIPKLPAGAIALGLRGALMSTHSRGAMLNALGGDVPVERPKPTAAPSLFGAPRDGELVVTGAMTDRLVR